MNVAWFVTDSSMDSAFATAAEHLAACKQSLLTRWRESVRADSRLPDSRLTLSDRQLEDHLPDLIDTIIGALRGDRISSEQVRQNGAGHGSTRRAQGYLIAQAVWEFAMFRKLVRESVEQLIARLSPECVFAVLDTVLNLIDISELGSVERYVQEEQRERDAAREQLRRVDQQKDRFLAVLSHELRNPLASIRTAAHVLNGQHVTASGRQRALEIIDRQTRHQTRLIDDLLDLNRISQGRIELRLEPVDLRQAVKNVIDTYLPAIESKSISFRFDYPGREIMLLADSVRIEQIISNLLTNSLKFTDSGGSIELSLAAADGCAVLTVRDSGAGIEPSRLAGVFELFSQARTGKGGEGLGIGLWLARQLVEMHGGQIELTSGGQNQGTQVVVRLKSMSTMGKAGKRILLVEDDPDQRELLAMALAEIDAEVVGAKDGSEAIRIMKEREFDVCLLDLSLPDISGYELIGRLTDLHRDRPPVMIALTGYGRPEDAARVKAAGFQHHVVKPADINQLQRLIGES